MEVLDKLLYYLWVVPVGWMVVDRNNTIKELREVQKDIAEEKARNESSRSDIRDIKEMLKHISQDVSTTKQTVEYWKGRQDSQN